MVNTIKKLLCTPLKHKLFNLGETCYEHVKVTEWQSQTKLYTFLEDIPVICRCVMFMRHTKYAMISGENFPAHIASTLV